MAISMALGQPLFKATYKSGTPVLPVTGPCKILYIEAELGPDGLQGRLRNIVADLNPAALEMFVTTRDTAMRLDTPEGFERIKAEVGEVRPDVLIIDPMAKFHLQDENSAQEMGYVMRMVDHLVEDFGCAVILVHHLKKPNEDHPARGGDRLRGSSAVFADVDTVVELERLSDENVKEPILKMNFEMRRGEPLESLFFKRLLSGAVVYMGEEFRWGSKTQSPHPRSKFSHA
jgi:RecA-family ATPase